ncbi:GNAT family N-acetyltransferase [Macellibacteroides fermentans]|uniref:GNAT family N-acetyltransferase n=1 Tax=Macellibacteroides fermentans TaxID=879969 RepID=UPI003B9242C0
MENSIISNYSFHLINENEIPWNDIEQCCDATIFKSKDWKEFLVTSLPLKSFIVKILKDGNLYGYFVGFIFSKFGLKIIGSPFEGWNTSYLGISTKENISRKERVLIYKELCKFALKHCLFIQFADWNLDFEDLDGNFKNVIANESYYLDLSPNIESLYRSFKQKSCQYSIKKAQKLGVVICEPDNIDIFADEYYNELIDVFAKQDLKPTYDAERVKLMLHCLSPQHRVLLEARHPDTNSVMATIIFVLHNDIAFYWGAACYRTYQKFCPNELLMFEAIKLLKARGVTLLEMEGIRPYKEKYNPVRYSKPKVMVAKYPILIEMKKLAKILFYKLKGFKI